MKNLPDTAKTENHFIEPDKNDNEFQWEQNHIKIGGAIVEHVKQFGSVPSKTHIARITGLSRETVYSHLKDFAENPLSHNPLETLNAVTEHLIANVLRKAVEKGRFLQAMRLYLELAKTFINPIQPKQQNNYVQINKTIINQQIIQQLKPEQLERIEQIIAIELNKPKGLTGVDTFDPKNDLNH